MSSSSRSKKIKASKPEPLGSSIKQATDVFDFSQANVTSNTNNAIDLVLETINMIDKLNISSSRYSNYSNDKDNSKGIVRGKLYSVLDVLRKMTPNHGNRMHVNQLPDDCLLTIFTKNLSMQKIMRSFRGVCHRWKAVVEDSVCAPKRALKLFGGYMDVRQYGKKLLDSNMFADKQLQLGHQDHHLILPRWILDRDQHFFRTLGIIFPNVQHLVIGVQNVSNLNQWLLCRFFVFLPQLTRLTVFFKWSFQAKSLRNSSELCERFFKFIDSMKSLKHLDLLGDSMLGCDNIADLMPRVLPQLEHLSMENYRYRDSGSILVKLGPNLNSLRLDQFDQFQTTTQSSLKPESIANITELRVSKVKHLQTVKFVCQTFSHLNKLELSFAVYGEKLPTFPLDSHLLTTLNHHPQIDSLSLENLQIDLNSFTPSTFAPSTVKSLHLSNLSSNQILSDGVQLIRTLASIFPRVQHLDYQFSVPMSLQAFDYNECKIDDEYVRKHFPHLRDCRVYYRQCEDEYIGRLGSGCDCSGAIECDNYADYEMEMENRDWDEYTDSDED